jgi:hypothetical protein
MEKCIAVSANGNACINQATIGSYCKLHSKMYEKQLLIDELAKNNKKMCKGSKCKVILDIDDKTKCRNCLDKDILKDTTLYAKKQELNSKLVDDESQICTSCKNVYTLDKFRDRLYGKPVKTCANCRESNKVADMKRADDLVRKAAKTVKEQTPQYKETRRKWRRANPEYSIQARLRMKVKDPLKYHKRCAADARRYRDNNPDYVIQCAEDKKTKPLHKYTSVKNNAKTRNLEFKLSLDECKKLFILPCVYCGIEFDKVLHGLDRSDNTIGYIRGNVVPCCMVCNFIKSDEDVHVFYRRLKHIANYNKLINVELLSIRDNYRRGYSWCCLHFALYTRVVKSVVIANKE